MRFRNRVLTGYAEAAEHLIDAYEAIDCEALFAPVRHFLPGTPCDVIDIGAGAGRDAAWLAGQGHRVTAVEPVAAFRAAGLERHGRAITWIDDHLPELNRIADHRFDFCLVHGVWQHLPDETRPTALRRIAALLAPGGRVLLALRQGPGAPDRPVTDTPVPVLEGEVRAAGFAVQDKRETASLQQGNRAAGVTWTWLLLARDVISDR